MKISKTKFRASIQEKIDDLCAILLTTDGRGARKKARALDELVKHHVAEESWHTYTTEIRPLMKRAREAEYLSGIVLEAAADALKRHDEVCNCVGKDGSQEKGCLLWVESFRAAVDVGLEKGRKHA